MAKCDYKELSSMFYLFGPPQTNEILWGPEKKKEDSIYHILYYSINTAVYIVMCVVYIVYNLLPSVSTQSGE